MLICLLPKPPIDFFFNKKKDRVKKNHLITKRLAVLPTAGQNCSRIMTNFLKKCMSNSDAVDEK